VHTLIGLLHKSKEQRYVCDDAMLKKKKFDGLRRFWTPTESAMLAVQLGDVSGARAKARATPEVGVTLKR